MILNDVVRVLLDASTQEIYVAQQAKAAMLNASRLCGARQR